MKRARTIVVAIAVLSITACAAPEIADWPPTPPDVSEDVIQRYVDRYASEITEPPTYTDIELEALRILQTRKTDRGPRNVISTRKNAQPNQRPKKQLSRNEINAIKRRVARRYESSHDRRHELRAKYGL